LGENKRALTEEEKQSLEGQFTLLELEESLDKSNSGSAAGWDGVSYLFIKKFWYILGNLLKLAVNEGVEHGIMSQNFRLGIIKLIPKKGDATKVEDWRPITLLSCSYKIFSGAVANRIEKFLHKLVGRGQKGFMKNRNIHMCTMNIMDNISQAWNEEEETGILCVDFNKAFDSVEHYVIEQVLKFFNFGHYMVRTIMTLLKDRQGVVLLTNGFSKKFDIKRGTPQGDRTSPYIFILCVEILILKLEDLAKENVGMNVGVNELIRLQNDLASGIIEAYADDLTVMFKWSRYNLSLILDCIVDFGELTGLTVNVNKTQLMLVGKNANDEGLGVGDSVGGIKIVEKVTILGITIDRTLSEMDYNWIKVKTKMGNIARYWGQFNISLPARIMVAKTYIISQAIYLMGLLKLKEEIAEDLNRIVIDFVVKNSQALARHKWYIPATRGGYNMVDVKILDLCIKASWIFKWCKNPNIKDYGDVRVINGMYMSLDQIKRGEITYRKFKGSEPILDAFLKYKLEFYKLESNILGAKIFGNVGLGERGGNVEDEIFERGRREQIWENIKDKKIKILFLEGGQIKDKTGMEQELNIRLSMVEFFRLRTAMNRLKGWVGNNAGPIRNLREILIGKKQGGGILRKYITKKWDNRDIMGLGLIRNLGIEGTEYEDGNYLGRLIGIWTENAISAGLKEFIFKYLNGRLYLNVVRARFDNTINPACSLCLLNDINTAGRETMIHLFWECPELENIKQMLGNRIGGDGRTISREEFWIGKRLESNKKSIVWNFVVMTVKWYIFKKSRCHKQVNVHEVIWELDQLKILLGKTKYNREMIDLWGG
jgi:hypothetical protein